MLRRLLLGIAALFVAAVHAQELGTYYPKFPHDPNALKDCTWWIDNDGSMTCDQILLQFFIDLEDFRRWNPSIGEGCAGLETGKSYCVEALFELPPPWTPPTSTSSTSIPTSTITGTGTGTRTGTGTATATGTSTPTPTPTGTGTGGTSDATRPTSNLTAVLTSTLIITIIAVSSTSTGATPTTTTCRKSPDDGLYAGVTQQQNGEDDGIYRHSSQSMGTILSVTSGFDRDQWFFARIFRRDRDDLLGWFTLADGSVRYGLWRNDGNGVFTKINDLNVNDNCPIAGVNFVDVNADGLDDLACVAPDGNVFASINQGDGSGVNPPNFVNIGLWKPVEAGYLLPQVRVADMDGDGRADYCALSSNGDVRVWRNAGTGDTPTSWEPLGLRFTGNGMDISGVRFKDINGDGRDDWLWVSDTGATTTWTNARSCARGKLGDGLNVAWRQGFNGNATSGPIHPGRFEAGARNRTHFARIFGEPMSFALLGRQDYVYLEHVVEGTQHRFNMQVFKNTGQGGSKLKADGNKYCDMTGSGRDDYIWAAPTGELTLYPNAGKTIISGTESYWGPSSVIFRPRDYVGRDLDRRDLHLTDWDGNGRCDIVWVDPDNENRVSVFLNLYTPGGAWTWFYQPNPAPALYCPEKRGLGIHDLAVSFADISGNGRGDYICIEKDGRLWGWTHNNNGTWTYIDQFKSSKGHDRADLRWGDVNGDGRDDTIWINKFTGDAFVYENLGRQDTGGSRYLWGQQPGGGPWPAYTGKHAGTCEYYPDFNGDGRADQHSVRASFYNDAETWYNICK